MNVALARSRSLATAALLNSWQNVAPNLVKWSEAFTDATWTKGGAAGVNATADQATAPDGTLTADAILAGSTTSGDRVVLQSAIPVAAAGAYTLTVWAKRAVNTKRVMLRESAQVGATACFDLSTGALVATAAGGSGSIIPYANGWYRLSLTVTLSAGTTTLGIYLMPDSGQVYADRNYSAAVGDGLYLWGAQVCRGPRLTRYIRTGATLL